MRKVRGVCSVDGCDGAHRARGLCGKHLFRLTRHGHLAPTRPADWGKREKHPLYNAWRWIRDKGEGPICERWGSFWSFVEDVGEKVEGKVLRQIDKNRPYGPDNFYWREPYRLLSDGKKTTSDLAIRAEWMRNYRKLHPEKFKHYELKRKFGMSREDYERMSAEQGGVCAICKKPEASLSGVLAVDHDHRTFKIRSLLCSHCNKGLGNFRDDVDLMLAAASYLEKWA